MLIGAEGTLAFIAEAVLNTVPDLPVKYTGLLLFPDLHAAADSIVPLQGRRSQGTGDHGSRLAAFGERQGRHSAVDSHAAAIRGRFAGRNFSPPHESARSQLEKLAAASVGGLNLCEPAPLHPRRREQALLWKIRAGMFPSVGSVRKSGTTVIIEDVAFPIESLANAARRSERNSSLFTATTTRSSSATPKTAISTLSSRKASTHQAAIDQYSHFIDDVVKLVVNRYDGALKAEHGTGRNMAPFVETEWGSEAYEIMRRLKQLTDPDNLLNPGVIINPDRVRISPTSSSFPRSSPRSTSALSAATASRSAPAASSRSRRASASSCAAR